MNRICGNLENPQAILMFQSENYRKGYVRCFWPLLAPRGCHLGGLGASVLANRGTILAPRVHPGESFWHLGTTLEDHGGSRMDSRWSGTDVSLIWG